MCKSPSAKSGVSIPKFLKEIIEQGVYKADYSEITTYFQNHPVDYEMVIRSIVESTEGGMFE